MLATTDPREAYRRSTFDARVQSGNAGALVTLCLEQAIDHLGIAMAANERQLPTLRSRSLTKAVTAITALEMGVDSAAPLADALFQFYRSARQTILDSVIKTDNTQIATLRTDLSEVLTAFRVH